MAWAGALEGIFIRYAQDFDAKPLNLYLNHRSGAALRRMQSRMVQTLEPAAAEEPQAISGTGGVVEVRRFANEYEEANDIADFILDKLDSGVAHSDIAVLIAKEPELYAAPLYRKLDELRVPYRSEHISQDLAAEPVVSLIFDFLTVVLDSGQPDVYKRLMGRVEWLTTDMSGGGSKTPAAGRYIQKIYTGVRSNRLDFTQRPVIVSAVIEFLELLGRPAISSLSPQYQTGQLSRTKCQICDRPIR